MRKLPIILLALWCLSSSVAAAENHKPSAAIQLQQAPSSLKPGSAYILLKTNTAKSGLFPIQHVLIRVPTENELAAYIEARQSAFDAAVAKMSEKQKANGPQTVEQFGFDYHGEPNSFVVSSKKFLEDGEMRTVLLEVKTGRYIVYGVTLGDGGLVSCNCLGTIGFEAKGGVITDIGSLFADKVHKDSPVPNLEDKLGEQMFQYGFVMGQALVPANDSSLPPAALKGLPIELARFEIIEQFYEPGVGSINRLAPIPGLLGYKDGKPVDLRK